MSDDQEKVEKVEFDGPEEQPDTDQAETEPVEETKTDTEPKEEPEPKPEDKELKAQESMQKKIDRHVFEKHEERRKREALEQRLSEAEQKLAELTQKDVVVPELPDVFDPQYEIKLRQREDALRLEAENTARKRYEQEAAQAQQAKQAEEQRLKIARQVDEMYAGGEQLGIKKDELKAADDRVAMFIHSPDVARYILERKEAPLIVKHLSDSPTELEKLGTMNAVDAAAYIATTVLPKARKLKPRQSNAPDPLDIPGGRPAGAKKDAFLDSVTFE